MGLIFDTSVIVAAERSGMSPAETILHFDLAYGGTQAALSSITAVELYHGVYRAKSPAIFDKRLKFTDEILRSFAVIPVSSEIAQLAGKILGEQMNRGFRIDLADLLIGSTAIYLGLGLATLNEKHFANMPGLTLVRPLAST